MGTSEGSTLPSSSTGMDTVDKDLMGSSLALLPIATTVKVMADGGKELRSKGPHLQVYILKRVWEKVM